jgi:hypothetical protein
VIYAARMDALAGSLKVAVSTALRVRTRPP